MPATTSMATTAAPIAISDARERRAPAGAASSASRNSSAVRKRSSGVFASARAIAAFTAGGVSARSFATGGAGSVRCATIMLCTDPLPPNGCCPASIS